MLAAGAERCRRPRRDDDGKIYPLMTKDVDLTKLLTRRTPSRSSDRRGRERHERNRRRFCFNSDTRSAVRTNSIPRKRNASTSRFEISSSTSRRGCERRRARHLFFRDQTGQSDFDKTRGRTESELSRRAEALAAIMSAKRGILIVGMHGKTTTSAMTSPRLARRRTASVALRRR